MLTPRNAAVRSRSSEVPSGPSQRSGRLSPTVMRPSRRSFDSVATSPSPTQSPTRRGSRSPSLRSLLSPSSSQFSNWSQGVAAFANAGSDGAPSVWSVAVTSLGPEYDDIYVNQLPLSYNGQPVYIGNCTGRYLFHYEPSTPGLTGCEGCPGWCVDACLGAGRSPLRLQLGSPFDRKTSQPRLGLGHRLLLGLQRRRSEQLTTSVMEPEEEVTDEPVRRVAAEQAGVYWVPHLCSPFEEAVREGKAKSVASLAKVYRAKYPRSHLWQYSVGHKQWQSYGEAEQAKINEASALGKVEVMVSVAGGTAVIDLRQQRHVTVAGPAAMRRLMRTVFSQPDPQTGEAALTSDPAAIRDWAQATVWMSSGQLSMVAPDPSMLELLISEGLVDPTLWDPPAVCPAAKSLPPERRPVLNAALTAHTWAQLSPNSPSPTRGGSAPPPSWSALPSRAGQSPLQSPTLARRSSLTSVPGLSFGASPPPVPGFPQAEDGLLDFAPGRHAAPEARGAAPSCSPLELCAALPSKRAPGLYLDEADALQACHEALMLSAELQRQHVRLNPHHVHAVFLYTYPSHGRNGGVGQVFYAVNRALRDGGAAADLWRPLVWHLEEALSALPPCLETAYRGISAVPRDFRCRGGDAFSWKAFSLAVAKVDALGWALRFKLRSPDGLRDVSRLTARPTQRQYLLRRDVPLRISTVANSPASGPDALVEVVCADAPYVPDITISQPMSPMVPRTPSEALLDVVGGPAVTPEVASSSAEAEVVPAAAANVPAHPPAPWPAPDAPVPEVHAPEWPSAGTVTCAAPSADAEDDPAGMGESSQSSLPSEERAASPIQPITSPLSAPPSSFGGYGVQSLPAADRAAAGSPHPGSPGECDATTAYTTVLRRRSESVATGLDRILDTDLGEPLAPRGTSPARPALHRALDLDAEPVGTPLPPYAATVASPPKPKLAATFDRDRGVNGRPLPTHAATVVSPAKPMLDRTPDRAWDPRARSVSPNAVPAVRPTSPALDRTADRAWDSRARSVSPNAVPAVRPASPALDCTADPRARSVSPNAVPAVRPTSPTPDRTADRDHDTDPLFVPTVVAPGRKLDQTPVRDVDARGRPLPAPSAPASPPFGRDLDQDMDYGWALPPQASSVPLGREAPDRDYGRPMVPPRAATVTASVPAKLPSPERVAEPVPGPWWHRAPPEPTPAPAPRVPEPPHYPTYGRRSPVQSRTPPRVEYY